MYLTVATTALWIIATSSVEISPSQALGLLQHIWLESHLLNQP